jgi:hypothetical protein
MKAKLTKKDTIKMDVSLDQAALITIALGTIRLHSVLDSNVDEWNKKTGELYHAMDAFFQGMYGYNPDGGTSARLHVAGAKRNGTS